MTQLLCPFFRGKPKKSLCQDTIHSNQQRPPLNPALSRCPRAPSPTPSPSPASPPLPKTTSKTASNSVSPPNPPKPSLNNSARPNTCPPNTVGTGTSASTSGTPAATMSRAPSPLPYSGRASRPPSNGSPRLRTTNPTIHQSKNPSLTSSPWTSPRRPTATPSASSIPARSPSGALASSATINLRNPCLQPVLTARL